jgi:hypothetical protein
VKSHYPLRVYGPNLGQDEGGCPRWRGFAPRIAPVWTTDRKPLVFKAASAFAAAGTGHRAGRVPARIVLLLARDAARSAM